MSGGGKIRDTGRDRKWIVRAALAAAVLVLPLYAAKVYQKTDYTDFLVYYRAASRAARGDWREIYTLMDGASPFRYAPCTLPLFRPFAELSYDHARLLWFFLQYAWFGLGFYLIYRALSVSRFTRARAGWIACASLLYVLRFCLDCFTIGQISSLMFLGFCAGLYGWMSRRKQWAGAGVFIPTLFKVGPGYLYLLFLISRARERLQAIGTAFACLASLCLLSLVWVGSLSTWGGLWRGWATIVASDSIYYDASHYGSQSLKSALLRMANQGWISHAGASLAYLSATCLGCLLILIFWSLRRPRTIHGAGLFYALGLFPYMWFMPETFKYSLTTLAIPVALLLAIPARQMNRFTRFALAFGFLTLSLAGKDIVGDAIFFGLQKASVPLLATVFLGIAVCRQALADSAPRIPVVSRKLPPWEILPAVEPGLEATLLVPLPLQAGTLLDTELTRKTLSAARERLEKLYPGSFEILVIPFGDRFSEFHPLIRELDPLARLLPPAPIDGRGAALREGFLVSRGKRILTAHVEQPCHPDFYERASRAMDEGYDLVRADRRNPESRFRIPVRLLPLVYGRHRMGVLFNAWVRAILPIHARDTHSGTLAMSRRLALHAFAVQSSPSFLSELELSLATKSRGYRETGLPVLLELAEEKGFRRMAAETIMILTGLPLLALRFRRGCYEPVVRPEAMTADDWGLSPGVNRGILELARAGVIRRVSILANGRYLHEGLEELKAVPEVKLGLHFNLTYGFEKAQPAWRLLLRALDPARKPELMRWAREQFLVQLETLTSSGVRVGYLDGHQHIHLLPGMIDALADLVRVHGISVVRLPYDRALWLSPRMPVLVLALLARSAMRRAGFRSLSCVYPHDRDFLDQGALRAKVSRSARAEIIVHPAELNDLATLEHPDPYREERVQVYRALRMIAFSLELEAR